MVLSKKKIEYEKRWAFFNMLWSKLPKNKFCSLCKKPIFGENKSTYWDHLLERKKYPNLEFEEENIIFVCPDCHARKSMGNPSEKHKEAIGKAKQKFL